MPENLRTGFKLGEIEVKPAEGVLIVGGQPRRVEPKAMDVLLALAGAGESVVSREELTAQVWPRGFVTDGALNRCISNLRSALEDDRRAPQFIVTVPRRGYRLASPVELLTPPASSGSTLVLPFQHLSAGGDPYLADGLTELLIARLSVCLVQPVISRSTAMSFREAQRDIRFIRDQLGARWVVEGSVLQQAEQVQVVVQLIDASTDAHVWANSWTRILGDALTVLNEVSRQIAARISSHLESPRREAPALPELPTALLRHYLHGLHLMAHRTHVALRKAKDCFARVLKEVPDHGPSLAGLANCWLLLAHYGAVPSAEGFGKARQFAEAAMQATPGPEADPLACLAGVAFFHEWDFERAKALVERALALNPNHGIGLLVAADISLVMRRNERAQSHIDRALASDPLNAGLLMNAGDYLILQRRFGEAINALAAALEIESDMRPARLRMALACAFDGRAEEALRCLRQARETGGEDPAYFEYQAIVSGRLGQAAAARTAAGRLEKEFNSASPWALARAWASAGMAETATRYLQAALSDRNSSMPFLGITPVFDELRKRPEVKDIMGQLGLD